MKIILAALVLLIFPNPLLADSSKETNDDMCNQDMARLRDCCMEGRCVRPGLRGQPTFSLPVGNPRNGGIEKIRDYRAFCYGLRGQQIPGCPGGKHVLDQDDYYQGGGTPSCNPNTLTRMITLSQEPDRPWRNRDNYEEDLLTEHKYLCLNAIDDMRRQRDGNSFLKLCDPEMVSDLNQLHTDVTAKLDSLIRASRTINDSKVPRNTFVRNLKDTTCPVVQDWSGAFTRSYNGPDVTDSKEYGIKMQELFDNEWGKTLSETDQKKLYTNECTYQKVERRKHSPGVPCDGRLYFRTSTGKPGLIRPSEGPHTGTATAP